MNDQKEFQAKQAAAHFLEPGSAFRIRPYGNGHIGDTYLVESGQEKIILQRINTGIFPDPESLQRNILLVTDHIRKKILERAGDPFRETLTFLRTNDGSPLYRDASGVYRASLFVPDSRSFDQAEEGLFEEAGRLFGVFQKDLSDFPAESLTEILPGFHDTAMRFEQFLRAVREDRAGRAAGIREDIDFLTGRSRYCTLYAEKAPNLPLRVTHNDTKLNNVLMDIKTGKGLAVIDLDTVMPGLIMNDFGDAIRFGANTAAENERDLSKVSFSLPLYRAFLSGFLAGADGCLSEDEVKLLPYGSLVMTYEQALRFLADYLNGDTYYKVSAPDENLVRARCQSAFLRELEKAAKDSLFA